MCKKSKGSVVKKVLFFVLGIMCFVSNASAVNIVDDNPLYIPIENRFYSISSIGSHTGADDIKSWTVDQEFGYGITNRWNVTLATSVTDRQSFDKWSWDNVAFETKFRALDFLSWKGDLIAGCIVSNVWAPNRPLLEKDVRFDSDTGYAIPGTGTEYTWAVGMRGGYTISQFTIAFKALFEYFNTEAFNWSEPEGSRGIHIVIAGVDGRFALSDAFTLIGNMEYVGFIDKEWYGIDGLTVENAGIWTGKLGINYNIDATKFVGVYVSASLNHNDGDNYDEWGFDNGVGFGAKFGIGF